MTRDHASKNNPQSVDESYWVALFRQEETDTAPARDASIDQMWTDIGSLLDKRTDGVHQEQSSRRQPDPWQMAKHLQESDQILELDVTGYNKGGLLVRWRGLPGFVPASQLIDFPRLHVESLRLQSLKEWINKRLKLKIIEVNQQANRLVFSERATLIREDERSALLSEINCGDRLEGKVTNLTKFGAFVDLGGVEGLIHISELSWSRVVHPADVVEPGQAVLVQVLRVDADKGRVALSMKRLRPNPWSNIESRYRPGQTVEGVISKVVSFGAFLLLEDELEGLIHISELAEGTFLHPRNVVRRGERVVAQVLEVDGQAKRLALSMRRVRS